MQEQLLAIDIELASVSNLERSLLGRIVLIINLDNVHKSLEGKLVVDGYGGLALRSLQISQNDLAISCFFCADFFLNG